MWLRSAGMCDGETKNINWSGWEDWRLDRLRAAELNYWFNILPQRYASSLDRFPNKEPGGTQTFIFIHHFFMNTEILMFNMYEHTVNGTLTVTRAFISMWFLRILSNRGRSKEIDQMIWRILAKGHGACSLSLERAVRLVISDWSGERWWVEQLEWRSLNEERTIAPLGSITSKLPRISPVVL